MFILMLLIHTPDVDTYSGVKCGVFINLNQNVRTGRPPNALLPSAKPHYSTTVQQNISAVSYSASCKELRLVAPSMAAVSYFAIFYLVDQFQVA